MEVQFLLAYLVVAANVPPCNILTKIATSGNSGKQSRKATYLIADIDISLLPSCSYSFNLCYFYFVAFSNLSRLILVFPIDCLISPLLLFSPSLYLLSILRSKRKCYARFSRAFARGILCQMQGTAWTAACQINGINVGI